MLHVVDRGKGEALVFVHAFPLDHTMWSAQAEFFGRQYRVVTPDLPGFGLSGDTEAWTIPQVGDQLIAVMDELGIERCTLIGLSIGGYISLPLAINHPTRVSKLVLAHTRARADTETERAARNDMIGLLQREGIAALPGRMLPRLLGPQASAEVQNWVRQTIEGAETEAAIHAVEAMRDRADSTPRLSQVTCPTLVIAGDGDAIIKVEECRELAEAIPNGKLAVIPKTGHLSNIEDPAAFNKVLSDFVIPS
jgi:3-oxoadipate enol-lactonase